MSFGRYQYKRLPFRAAPAGDMFQWKIDGIFNDMPNVYGTADDILVVGYENNREIMIKQCRRSYKDAEKST